MIFGLFREGNASKISDSRDLNGYSFDTKFQLSSEILKIDDTIAAKMLFSLRTTLNKLKALTFFIKCLKLYEIFP